MRIGNIDPDQNRIVVKPNKRRSTPSNPRRVAQEVIRQVMENKKVNVGEAMLKTGYAPGSAHNPHLMKKKEEFQAELFDFVSAMEEERKRCLKELDDPKVRKKASYRDRIDAINKLTQNIQLITGGSTSNEVMTIKWDD